MNMNANAKVFASSECISCHRPLPPSLFCPYCGVFVSDRQGTVVMASRLARLGAAIVNALLMICTLYIGWIIWWFIVAPRGQNPGKAVVGLRVIRTDGHAATTGYMFVRGLLGMVLSIVPFYLDNLWLLWDKDAQTLHDKAAGTVVVQARGSERVVAEGPLGPPPRVGEIIILPAALVLFIVGFLPWYSVDLGPFGTYSHNGWQSPGEMWSILAILVGLAMAGVVVVKSLGTTAIPDSVGGITWPKIHAGAGVLALVFLLIKFLGNHDYTAIGLYLGILSAAALAVGGLLMLAEESAA